MRTPSLETLSLSVILDLALGEPSARLHPVICMGRYLNLKGGLLSCSYRPWVRFGLGLGLVSAGAALSGGLAWWVQGRLNRFSPAWRLLLSALLLKPLFSVAALLEAGSAVQRALSAGDLEGARQQLGWHLVSRDTAELSESEVAGAAVASLAENLTDSAVAPLLYAALFGLPGAAVYRFVNTADALLGYRTPELESFGKAAARADDLLNLVPARLAAGLLALAFALSGGDARAAWRGMRRDRGRTPSPNGSWTMALIAAGLGVRLEKRGVYVLNAAGRAAAVADITRTQRLLQRALVLGLGVGLLASCVRGQRA